MIAPLRRRHRLMVSVLALVLPAMLWLAVTSRERVPIMAVESLPQGAPPELTEIADDSADGWFVRGTLEPAPGGPTLVVRIRHERPLPRAMFAWRIADDAAAPLRFVAVATPGAARLTLPPAANAHAGALVLWDIARGEQLDALPLPAAEHAP